LADEGGREWPMQVLVCKRGRNGSTVVYTSLSELFSLLSNFSVAVLVSLPNPSEIWRLVRVRRAGHMKHYKANWIFVSMAWFWKTYS
jgi:hypothetical protein